MSVEIFNRTLKKAVADSHLFICNSFTTEKELLTHFPNAVTTVVYCDPVKPTYYSCGKCQYCARINFFETTCFYLTVGTIEPRKNYERLVSVWKNNFRFSSTTLVIVGKRGWKSRAALRELKKRPSNLVHLHNVCDFGVLELTKKCSVYLSASLGEGFNYPAMDAALLSKPLLLSDIPIHRELYKNDSLFFNPYDETSIAAKLKTSHFELPEISEIFLNTKRNLCEILSRYSPIGEGDGK